MIEIDVPERRTPRSKARPLSEYPAVAADIARGFRIAEARRLIGKSLWERLAAELEQPGPISDRPRDLAGLPIKSSGR